MHKLAHHQSVLGSAAGARAPWPAAAQRAQRRQWRDTQAWAARTELQSATTSAAQPSTSGRFDGEELPGPQGAFQPGQEAAARQQLFNRIAPVYDEVRRTPSP
jgi:hypothetical protein